MFGRKRNTEVLEEFDPMHWLHLGRLVEAAELASIVLTTRQDVPSEFAAIGRTLGVLSSYFSEDVGQMSLTHASEWMGVSDDRGKERTLPLPRK